MRDFSYSEPRPGCLCLLGELTLGGAVELKDVLLRALESSAELELDLLNVTRVDTAGVQLLLMLQRGAEAADKRLVLLGYSLAVEEALDLLDLTHHFARPAAVVWG